MSQQWHKFIQTLDAIVVALDRPALVVAEVAALGQRHTGYGVVAGHFSSAPRPRVRVAIA